MQQHTWHKMLFWKYLFKHIKLLMLCKVEPIQNASSFKRNPGQKFLKYMYQEAQAHVQNRKKPSTQINELSLPTAKEKNSQMY